MASRQFQRWAVLALVLSVSPARAGEEWIRLLEVSDPQRLAGRALRVLQETAEAMPEEQREMLLEATSYQILFENTSNDKFCTALRLTVRFLDEAGRELGTDVFETPVQLKPHQPESIAYQCADRPCRRSASLEVVAFEPAEFTGYEDRWIEVGGRTWHVVDDWDASGSLTLLPFSPGYYDSAPFEDRIFAAESFFVDDAEERAFRVEKAAIPASYPYPEGDIAWYSAAGLLVENGVAEKPGFLKAPGRIINTNIHGELPVGQFVRIENAEVWNKKLFGLHLLPICQLSPDQRRLNSWLYFRFEPGVLSSKDTATVEAAVREFLRPAPLSEVAATCGPTSGTLVHHLDSTTSEETVRAILGDPDNRRSTDGATELVYGEMTLRFTAGSLAGVGFGG